MAGKHIAVFNFPAHGHVNPSLPVVAELVRRGHRVTYFVPENYHEAVAATGATPVAYVSSAPVDWSTERIPAVMTPEVVYKALRFQVDEGFAPLSVAERRLADDRPDLIIYDQVAMHAGKLLARKWNVPAVMACTTFAANELYSPYASMSADFPVDIDPNHPDLAEMAKITPATLAEHDVPIEEFAARNEKAVLVYLPRSFQLGQEHFDDSYAFVGPALDEGGRHDDTDWTPPTDGRPLLLITMGSHDYENRLQFYRDCVTAFADSPWHVVMAVGKRIDVADLGPLPAHFEVHSWIPQPEILKHAKAFLAHGGMGSVMEALSNGVAPVVLPKLAEQGLIADQVVALGVGRKIAPTEVTPARLRAAVDELAADELAQQRAKQLSADIRAAGGAPAAADAVEAVLP
ncbi:macrolide family glycosyltransferase [Kutzneria sp. NPDC052558]|uniref:macrolide family glycosyltransferase n=1 Tax=Kutzneria sp. NPDC052558 TaxID=3364121 RepID=UPI0037CB87B5